MKSEPDKEDMNKLLKVSKLIEADEKILISRTNEPIEGEILSANLEYVLKYISIYLNSNQIKHSID